MNKNFCRNYFRYHLFIYLSILVILFANLLLKPANASEAKLPRFVSIKSSEANARKGPSLNADIDWVFIRKWEPVEVIEEYEQWRKIRDIKGEGGWVHSSVLSNKRHIIITALTAFLYKSNDSNSAYIAKLHKNVRCILKKCKSSWCKVECDGLTGWLMGKDFWGAYIDEINNGIKRN